MKKQLLSAAVGLAALAMAQSASAIVVGGVDFGATGLTSHLETTTVAETLITGNGQTLRGYGQVNTVNGNILYGVAPGSRLYFVFDQYTSQNFGPTSAEFTGGEVRVYLSGSTRNLLDFDSESNFSWIEMATPWAKLAGHDIDGALTANTATLSATGPNLSFTGSGDLDVVLGWGLAAVESYLDSDGILDQSGATTDMRFTSSGSFDVVNANDVCSLPTTQVAGEWCISGSADLRGATSVPEPSALALAGLGLLGLFATSRRRKA